MYKDTNNVYELYMSDICEQVDFESDVMVENKDL